MALRRKKIIFRVFHTDVVRCTGRGVFLTSRPKGAFLVEYAGELISAAEGYRREDDDNSAYRFYFSRQNTGQCAKGPVGPRCHRREWVRRLQEDRRCEAGDPGSSRPASAPVAALAL